MTKDIPWVDGEPDYGISFVLLIRQECRHRVGIYDKTSELRMEGYLCLC